MYSINKYQFNEFKCQASLHKSNYAVLINVPDKGIKYSPDFDFSEEYYILKELNRHHAGGARRGAGYHQAEQDDDHQRAAEDMPRTGADPG